MEYKTVRNCRNDHKSIEVKIIKWDGYITLLEILSNKVY